jgi:hypothetical protein
MTESHSPPHHPRSIDVRVKYVAGKPFHDPDAPRSQTLQALKVRVLTHFHLEEMSTPEFQKTYHLHDHKGRIENLAQTLGDYAGRDDKIELKLVEQITQGLEGPAPCADAVILEEHYAEVAASDEAHRWKLERPDWLEVWAGMSPRSAPGEVFQVRLLWARYPAEAPSLKFRDSAGRLDNPRAWPVLPGFRPGSLDACVNYCAEGFGLHPEWRTDPRFRWDPRGNSLLRVLTLLQVELDEHYQGRFGG